MKFLKKHYKIIIFFFSIFLVTVSYTFWHQIRPAVDALDYDQIANNLITGRGFRISSNTTIHLDEAITFHTPLYEYFLAGLYFLFGARNYPAVWLTQAILHTLSAFFIYLTCRKISLDGRKGIVAGVVAAGLFGFYPDLIEMTGILMTETLSIFFLTLFICLFASFYKKINYKNSLALGISFGLGVLVRSTMTLFLPFLAWYFLKEKKYAHFAVFLFLTVTVLTPWTVRNYITYHRFIPTSANGGYNLWVGNHNGGTGEGGNMPELLQAQQRLGYIQANDYGKEQFKKFVYEHPIKYIGLTFTRLVKYFSFARPLGFWPYQHGWSQVIFLFFSCLFSVAIFSLGWAKIISIFHSKKFEGPLIHLVIFAGLTVCSIIPIIIETRYRLPIYAFMAIFSGLYVADRLVEKTSLKYFYYSFGFLGLMSLVGLGFEWQKLIEKLGIIFN